MLKSLLEEPFLASHQTQDDLSAYLLERIRGFELPDHRTWETEAARLRQKVLDDVIFRGAPASWRTGECNMVWGDTIETDRSYRIRKLRYEALPGFWIPALLYEPVDLKGRTPVILNVNGHVGPPGKAIEYKQIRCINLAKRGMLALNPEWLFFGELQRDGYQHNRAGYLDLCGVAGVGVFFLAMQRGIDVLLAHEHADPERLAVTGLSGGGWQTIILSALDTRVKLAAPNAGYIGLDMRVKNREDIGDIEQNPADLVAIADYPLLTAMLAPRPSLLMYNHKDDCCFQAHRAKPSVFDPVRPLFEALGKGDSFEFHDNLDPGTHNYDMDNRQVFYRFLNRHFLPADRRIDAEIPSDDEVRTGEELTAGFPDGNADFVTIATGLAEELPRSTWPHGDPAAVQTWQREAKSRLRDVLRYRPLSVVELTPDAETKVDGYRVVRSTARLDDGWHIPVVKITGEDRHGGICVVTADDGVASALDIIERKVGQGYDVVAVDVLFHGDCHPSPTPAHQWNMVLSANGDRALGIQSAQLNAVIAAAGSPDAAVEVVGVGPKSAASVWTASALSDRPVSRVTTYNSLSSLKHLITQQTPYEDVSPLFCFGLLEAFDIKELIALIAPVPVDVYCAEGDDGAALLPLRELYARFGVLGFGVT